MIPFPLEKEAFAGKEMPPNLDVADACYYNGLRLIFQAFRDKHIDKATGTRMKQDLYRAYVSDKGKVVFLSREVLELSERIKRATEAYLAEPSLETADEMYRAFYNLPKSDNNLTTI